MSIQVPARNGGTLTRPAKGETMNPNGRPKKGIAKVNAMLLDEGYAPASKADIEANYLAMVTLEHDRLVKLAGDNRQPYLVNLIAKSLIADGGFDILEKMLDRSIGKAKQTVDTNIAGSLEIKQFDHIDKLVGTLKSK